MPDRSFLQPHHVWGGVNYGVKRAVGFFPVYDPDVYRFNLPPVALGAARVLSSISLMESSTGIPFEMPLLF
jgi:hypothetical protein